MKKFFAVFLVFSILALSGNLYSKEKKGAELVIQKKNRQVVKGELIAVKENSLLLKELFSGADATVFIRDIIEIRVVKQSKALLGGGIGLLVGAAVGAAAASDSDGSNESSFQIFSDSEVMAMGAAAGALLGLGIGAAIGGIAGTDKTIQVEGKTDSEVEEILEYLRKKARIPDYK